MRTIYNASNSIDARLVYDLLEQSGIESRVDGEYLQGGIGEVPAGGFIKVVINDEDYEKAKEIIAAWESNKLLDEDNFEEENKSTQEYSQPQETQSHSQSNKTNKYILLSILFLIIGVLIGAGYAAYYYNTPVSYTGIDFNGDGEEDEVWKYKGERISSSKTDANFDGNWDIISDFDHRGLINQTKLDSDFDTIFETIITYKNGSYEKTKSDFDNDGFYEYKEYYKYGRLQSTSFFDVETKKLLKTQQYQSSKLKSAKLDTTGDGQLDKLFEYDNYENVIKELNL